MCGIFGVLRRGQPPDSSVLHEAGRVQAHRGPDSAGLEQFDLGGTSLTFGHQRLAIIDLTPGGNQPMKHRSGDGWVIFNGELYNYVELREELAALGEVFETSSDTEVLLSALHRFGAEKALGSFNWMGALAWFDRANDQLVLARDAGSEKPLYYWSSGPELIFASELKTLLTLAGRSFELDRDVVGQFVYQGLTDASPSTFFRGISQLEPSSFARIDLASFSYPIQPEYYDPPGHEGDPASLSIDEYVVGLRELFSDSVRLRLRSDVPIGVLLSGGIDSSSIAAATTELSGGKVPTLLSAVSEDPRFDESVEIGIMEQHLGQEAEKIVLRQDPSTVVDDLALVNWYNDAPVAGLQIIGHYQMMARAKELGLTVILSGQGADEILLGYRKFLGFYLESLLRRRRWGKAATVLAQFVRNRSIINQFEISGAKRYLPGLQRLGRRGGQASSTEGAWIRGWRPEAIGIGSMSLSDRQRLDITKYSVPSLCHYEDRMSMAMSREIRLPFLDFRLVDYLLRAPDDYKIRDGWTKYALRKAVEPALPTATTWRKDKAGFSSPQGEWLKSELRDPVRDAFAADGVLAEAGIIDSAQLVERYEQYRAQPVNKGHIGTREILAPFSLAVWMGQYQQWIDA